MGISFQQSASTQYFKKVRHWLQAVGRLDAVAQAVINPSDDAYFNLISACFNQLDLQEKVIPVLDTADEVLPKIAARLARLPLQQPTAARAEGRAARQEGQQEGRGGLAVAQREQGQVGVLEGQAAAGEPAAVQQQQQHRLAADYSPACQVTAPAQPPGCQPTELAAAAEAAALAGSKPSAPALQADDQPSGTASCANDHPQQAMPCEGSVGSENMVDGAATAAGAAAAATAGAAASAAGCS